MTLTVLHTCIKSRHHECEQTLHTRSIIHSFDEFKHVSFDDKLEKQESKTG